MAIGHQILSLTCLLTAGGSHANVGRLCRSPTPHYARTTLNQLDGRPHTYRHKRAEILVCYSRMVTMHLHLKAKV